MTIHASPDASSGYTRTPCCHLPPHDLPLYDYVTLVPSYVDCQGPPPPPEDDTEPLPLDYEALVVRTPTSLHLDYTPPPVDLGDTPTPTEPPC